jgi:hypothetical protein
VPRDGTFGAGTLGPVLSCMVPVSGALRARAPFAGVRFRRDTKKKSTVSLQIDYALLEVTASCTVQCRPFAILFAPGYEASLHSAWGRLYGEAGVMLAGFPVEGDDRGVAQGLHGGVGADVFAGRAMTNISARLVWIQRRSGENVFGVQVGLSISPRLDPPSSSH